MSDDNMTAEQRRQVAQELVRLVDVHLVALGAPDDVRATLAPALDWLRGVTRTPAAGGLH